MEYTKVLLHCDNEFYADEVSSLLEKEGIACRLHDERNDTAYSYGAHGGNLPGIEVRVNESDYERALALVKPVEEAHRQFVPWCPECGSDDVVCTKEMPDGMGGTLRVWYCRKCGHTWTERA